MNISNRIFIVVLMGLVAAPLLAGPASDLVAKFPTKDSGEESKLAGELVKLGPDGVKEICGLLVPMAAGSKDDSPARFAIAALQRYAGRIDGAADRRMLASALSEALAGQKDSELRSFLVLRLQYVGGDENVPAILPLLMDETACFPACAALERIGTPAAVTALETALSSSQGARRVAIIKSLGSLKAAGPVEEIRKSAATTDTALRLAALWALANIGDAGSLDLLEKASISASTPYERSKLLSFRLLLAHRRFEAKDPQAAAICRELVKLYSDAKEVNVAVAALHELTIGDPEAALPELLAAADNPQAELRNGALDAAALIKGEAATAKWAARASEIKTPQFKVDVIAFLGRRGDPAALDAVIAATTDADANVRIEAAKSAVKLGGDKAIAPLVAMLKTPAHAAPIAEILGRYPGAAALGQMAPALETMPFNGKIAILDVLGGRKAHGHMHAVLLQTASPEEKVRAAAFRAAEKMATAGDAPGVLEQALKAKEDADTEAGLKVAVAAALQGPAGQEADAFLDALPGAPAEKRPLLLRAIGKLGGPKALAAVSGDLKSADPAVKDAAIRALAEWSDESAAGPLLEVATGAIPAEANQQIIALRGAIAATRNSKANSARKVENYGKAMAAAKRPDEKKLVLGALAAEHSPAALELAAGALEDAALKNEASLAVIKIAVPAEKGQKGLTGAKTIAALNKAIAVCPDAKVKAEGVKYVGGLK